MTIQRVFHSLCLVSVVLLSLQARPHGAADLPDLKIRDANVGVKGTAVVRVINSGKADASPSMLVIKLSELNLKSGKYSVIWERRLPVPAIPKGSEATVSTKFDQVMWGPCCPGPNPHYKLESTVDVSSQVAESDESNNSHTKGINTGTGPTA